MNMLLINNRSSITEIQIINSTPFIVMYMYMYEIIHHVMNITWSITEIQIINSTAFIVMYMHMYEIIHHYNIISYSIQVFITVYTLVYKEA